MSLFKSTRLVNQIHWDNCDERDMFSPVFCDSKIFLFRPYRDYKVEKIQEKTLQATDLI